MPPASRPSFELTSPRVARRYEGAGLVLGRIALLLVAGPFVVGVSAIVLANVWGDAMLQGLASSLLALELLGVPVAFVLALGSALLSITAFGRRRSARVTAGAAGLHLALGATERSIPRARIRAGLVFPGPPARVELHLRGGRVLEVHVAREAEGARLLAALGIGPAARRVALRIGSVNQDLVARCVGLPVFMFLWFVAIWTTFGPFFRHSWLTVAWLVVTLLSTWLLCRVARRTQVVVGSDGVRVERPFSSVWLPYAELTAVRTRGDQVLLFRQRGESEAVLQTRGGRFVLFREGGEADVVLRTGKDLAEALAQRIRDAQQVHAARGAAPRCPEALEWRGRDLAAWRDELRKLVVGGDYRATALSPEDVLRALDDADAPRDRRIGAALLLRIAGYPEARDRIRVAAEATADDALRAALEHAAEEEVDDAALARALRRA